ncbi:MAG: S9 family peptidase [Bacteroidales bacterium]|jgi:dipeptidyl-peptidase-4
MKNQFCSVFYSFLFLVITGSLTYGEDVVTLEKIYRRNLYLPNTIEVMNPMNYGEYYSVLVNYRYIIRHDYATGQTADTLFSLAETDVSEISMITDYSFNADESVILLTTEQHEIYRHSYSSDFYVYLRKEDRLIPVFQEGEQQMASLSPDGQKVSFVYQNNLYVKDIGTDKVIAVTSDGQQNAIINGMPDWVYEEEFTLKTGHYWSPDSRKIAFYRFDETHVRMFNLTMYESLYPEWYKYKYPKAGEENALVDIYVYNLTDGSSKMMETGQNKERYLPRMKWLPDSRDLCIIELNRRQNEAHIRIANTEKGTSGVFYTETNDRYISEYTDDFVTFFDSGKKALIMSEKDGFMHIYQYDTSGIMINQVTHGEWEVDKFYGLDENTGRIYYSSTEVSPVERHIYSIQLDGSGKTRISHRKGVNTVQFNTGFTYYILTHSDANTPYEYAIYNMDNQVVRILESNEELKHRVRSYFTEKEFFTFTSDHGINLYGYKILPPGFDEKRQYPVLVYVYGGPESQLVLDEWHTRLPWFQLLARKGYIVACVDNRGTNGRGEEFEKSTYLQLGKLETEDQVAFARYLSGLSYIDKKRIGIFGWSYGGYMSLLCLMNGNEVFKMGIAVAPVTDWRFYDTIYTERFMRKPQENPHGYDEGAPLWYVNNLKGKLLLIHGLADDNVHFQHSAMLIDELVRQNKQFDMQIYPNKNHSIYGGNTTYHLYKRMTDYILNYL